MDITFVHADTRRLPGALRQGFDLAYAAIGVLNWIDNLDAWTLSAAAALAPGGTLALLDIHPLRMAVTDPHVPVIDFPYGGGQPQRCDERGTYIDRNAELDHPTTVEYPHSLGEITTAAANAGLRTRRLVEYLSWPFDPLGALPAGDDAPFELRIGGGALPVMYSLVADLPQ